ncbi:glycosyltransferase family 4 protein [Citrifermentans bremense]|uniref:glycosyltransferase family 4 protein n=1 Tax=Citrifermentans bremense TaxID=60035 RepID=UPI0004133783|nr:glycosyltransferase family 1 protein [Citrifermentans bremense]
MVIGIYLTYENKLVGGGHVYQKCLFEDIVEKQRTVYANHRIIFFYQHDNDLIENQPGEFVNTSWYAGGLNEAAMRHQVDLVWFLSISSVDVDVPHILPVWDLQHCLQTFFPEVSSGGEYLARDKGYRRALPRATYVLTGTEAGKKEISFFYKIPEERVLVNPMPLPQRMGTEPVEKPEELKPLGLEQNGFLFYPAQFWPHKNHVVLLEALKILKERHNRQFKLVFTGSDHGNLKHVRTRIAEMGLERDVLVLGFVSDDSILWLYQNAFALTYPSFFGPDNIPPLEAFAAGCPVIAAKVSGAEEQLGEAAILVDPRHEEEFAAQVVRLLQDQALRKALVARGHAVAEQRSAEKYVQRVFAVIDDFWSIRRCWNSHFTLRYTPEIMQWIERYAHNREFHAIMTLLGICTDQALVDSCQKVAHCYSDVVAANKAAEEAIDRKEHDAAHGLLQKVMAECIDYAPAYRNLAKIHYSRSEIDVAFDLIQKANYYDSRFETTKPSA